MRFVGINAMRKIICGLTQAHDYLFLFFFSSRRRHTRLQGDWSSDVCSSDLVPDGWRRESDFDPGRREPPFVRPSEEDAGLTDLARGAVRLSVEDPDSPAARYCLERYFAELAVRFETGYDPARGISAAPAELTPPQGYFVLATLNEEPVGCGALKCHAAYGEIKRMWVATSARGLGLGTRILLRLEDLARERGLPLLRLETNKALTEAQSLYRRNGYCEVPAFNDEPYAHHWFEKTLA